MFSLMIFWPSSSIRCAASMIGPRMSYRTFASLLDLRTVFKDPPGRWSMVKRLRASAHAGSSPARLTPPGARRPRVRLTDRLLFRQSKCHVRLPRFRPDLTAPGRDHDELPPIDLIRRGGRITAGRQLRLPNQFPGDLVKCAKFLVRIGSDKDEPAGGHQRSAVILRAGLWDAPP